MTDAELENLLRHGILAPGLEEPVRPATLVTLERGIIEALDRGWRSPVLPRRGQRKYVALPPLKFGVRIQRVEARLLIPGPRRWPKTSYRPQEPSDAPCATRLVALDAHGRLLRAALGFLSVKPAEPELVALHRCFDNWRGIGDVVAGMPRLDYYPELRRYDGQGWRAMFFPSGFEHSRTPHAGNAWARSPWEAVQRAALDALLKTDAPQAPPRDWTVTDESPR